MNQPWKRFWIVLALCALLTGASRAQAAGADLLGSPTEKAWAQQWVTAKFAAGQAQRRTANQGGGNAGESFFSFIYNNKPSSEFLGAWKATRSDKPIDANRTERILGFSDPKTGLEIRCEGIEYKDFPAIEWVLKLKNCAAADTPVIESLQALDASLAELAPGTLYWSKGGVASFDDFAPQEKRFEKAGDTLHLQPGGGRSSNNVLPFFNASGAKGGVMLAIGWTGEWAAEFTPTAGALTMKAGMARTHLLLHPGEEIRTPKIMLLFYGGDRWRGQNLLRRFILAHHRPSVKGKPLLAPITWGVFGTTSASVHLHNIQKIIEHNLPVDYYWVDAGWYGKSGNWAADVGDWDLDRKLLPDGFKPLRQMLEKSGRHLMVWFEPERVAPNTAWARLNPQWLMSAKGNPMKLMNLGNPEARRFVTDFVSAKIDAFGLGTGCYRQDFNIAPLDFWKANDAPDRQGMAEIRYIEGLYAYWDALLARYPGMMIDNCASGGRRIDLETISRSTPFWRTDGPRDPVAHQCHSYGLLAWVPLSAISQDREGDDYEFRSSMCSALCINWQHSGDGAWWEFPENFPFDWAGKILAQYRSLREYYYGDYYPLTPYSQDRGGWMAWQLDRPEQDGGMVQAFRRERVGSETVRVKLHGLEPGASYALTNLDAPAAITMTGQALMESGLPITIAKQPGAAVITYRKPK